MITMNCRIKEIDILRGIGIIYVILGHLNPNNFLLSHIYSFHMFLFFFLSGIVSCKHFAPTRTYIHNKCKRLLYPYSLWILISFIMSLLISRYFPMTSANIFFFNGSVGWNSPLWFLMVAFETSVVNFLLLKYSEKYYKLILPFAFFASYLIITYKITLPFGFHIFPMSLFFCVLGHIVSKYDLISKIVKCKVKTKIIICISLSLLNLFSTYFNGVISVYHSIFRNIPITYISGISGCLLYYYIVTEISLHFNNKILSLLDLFGKNSLFILCTHYFLLKILQLGSLYFFKIDLWHYQNSAKALFLTLILTFIYNFLFKYTNIIKSKFKCIEYFL